MMLNNALIISSTYEFTFCCPQNDPALTVPTVGEIIFTVFDWMTTNKETISSTKDVWEYTRSLFPEENNLVVFEQVMTILKRHRLETLQTIPVCVNMCVAYWNPTHPKMQGKEYQNAHRTKCPVCTENRYLSDGTTERRRIYYFPFKEWFQDLFAKPDLSRFMENDMCMDDYPSGHVRRSDGWRQKVIARLLHTQYTNLCISAVHIINMLLSNVKYITCYLFAICLRQRPPTGVGEPQHGFGPA